jgi:hypothetical protein
MRPRILIPIAVLALAVACSETATSPTSAGGPLLSVTPQTFVGTLNDGSNGTPDNTPSGGHLANSSGPIQCVVDANLSINCSAYSISGVGNTDATGTISANWSGTVTCRNHGGQLVEVKTSFPTTAAGTFRADRKNGSINVSAISLTAPTASDFTSQANCPNGNWTKTLTSGPTLDSFSYTLLFATFSAPNFAVNIHSP